MLTLARDGYTEQQIKDALHGKRGSRKIRFRYDLLDKFENKKKELTNVMGGDVSYSALNEIKRTARFNIQDDGSIDWLSDRIQPFLELQMPQTINGVSITNVALGKITESMPGMTFDPGSNPITIITNGVLDGEILDADPASDGGFAWVQVDLGKSYFLSQIKIWHYYADGRRYNNKLEVSEDGQTWFKLFDSDINGTYAETSEGKTHNFRARNVRYIRDYLKGSNLNVYNHWVEIQAFEANRLNEWVAFPLGVFLLSSPTKTDTTGGIIRNVEAYDGTIILNDDKFDDIYTVTSGQNYKAAIISLLQSAGISKFIIEDTTKMLPLDMQFEIGSSKLAAVNALLSQINFTPIRVDVNGYFVSGQYISPSVRAVNYTYKDDALSVTFRGMSEELDLFNVPNKWVVVRTNAEELPLKSIYINSNATSQTSTVSRGRTIVDYREIDNIADQPALDAYTQRIAFEASQIFGKVVFETAIMPMHDYYDILKIEYEGLNINDKYTETSWSFPLSIGGRMKHEVRKVVNI